MYFPKIGGSMVQPAIHALVRVIHHILNTRIFFMRNA